MRHHSNIAECCEIKEIHFITAVVWVVVTVVIMVVGIVIPLIKDLFGLQRGERHSQDYFI